MYMYMYMFTWTDAANKRLEQTAELGVILGWIGKGVLPSIICNNVPLLLNGKECRLFEF